MKIEKAIEILELSKNMDFEGCSHDLEAAHQLGIEALKRIQEYRQDPQFPTWVLILPGESEK